MDITEHIKNELDERSERGVRKYGTTLADNNAEIKERLQHFKEEMLDGAQYAEWCIRKMDELEARMSALEVENEKLRNEYTQTAKA